MDGRLIAESKRPDKGSETETVCVSECVLVRERERERECVGV